MKALTKVIKVKTTFSLDNTFTGTWHWHQSLQVFALNFFVNETTKS